MGRSIFETVIGAVVIAVAGIFLFYAYQNSSLATVSGYKVQARFLSVGGLATGSDVRVGGVKIGSVTGLDLDQDNYVAIVTMTVANDVKLPTDTRVSVPSDGLLGGRYVSLKPGGSDDMVAPGGELSNTEDVASIEDLLGRAIFVISSDAERQQAQPSIEGEPTIEGE